MRALHHVGAAAPGRVTPTSDNAPGQARVEGNGKAESLHFVAKLRTTQHARGALVGVQLVRVDDSERIGSRWGRTKALTDIEVGDWRRCVGAPA